MSNSLWKVWDDYPPLEIPGTKYTLRGFSIAALRTGFYIRELNVQLDAGLASNYSPGHIFVTHGHSDHTASLPFNLYSAKAESRTQVYIPESSLKHVRNFIGSAFTLSTGRNFREDSLNADLIPVRDGIKIPIIISKKPIEVEVIKCYHSLACVGYGFTETRKKLRDEYVGMTGEEIGILRKSGIDITRDVELPFFLFLGDSSQVILEDPRLLRYSTIMIECTFIMPDELPNADETQHAHIEYLEPYIRKHPEIHFILYHFSQRYSKTEVVTFFEKLSLANVTVWAN